MLDVTFDVWLSLTGIPRFGADVRSFMEIIGKPEYHLTEKNDPYRVVPAEGVLHMYMPYIDEVSHLDNLIGDWSQPGAALPEGVIINKDAAILFWNDGTKTVVRRAENDKPNKRAAFLNAYFQKMSGLSKNQANRYLDRL